MSMLSQYKFFVVILLLTSCSLLETKINLKASDVVYIYDGDSITFVCIPEYHCEKNRIKVRVKGVDTPEIKGGCERERLLAREAKQHTVTLLRDARKITLVVDDSNLYDRYQRLLAYVYVDDFGLHDSLIKRGLGRSYDGGKRVSWC